jgi:FKBP-type peptidyl-prolyl cis-trans isomerase SlyD
VDRIEPNSRVVIDYVLRDDRGEVVSSSTGEVYIHGYAMLVPGLEAGLAGLGAGDAKKVVVPPDAGFGDHDAELVFEVDRADVPSNVKVGDEIVADSPEGEEAVMRVVEVKGEGVVVDMNHPLAGKTLTYEVTVKEVRPGTDAEVAEAARAFDEAGYGEGDPEPRLVQLTSKKSAKRDKK